jgi:GntR family transcriptional regulator
MLDDSRPAPVYRQIATAYEHQIREGLLPPGSPIPSERELALERGISRMTARRAIDVLALRGLVERRGRVGVTVARPKIIWDLTSVAGLHEQLSGQGITPGAEVLRAETVAAGELDPEVGQYLHLTPQEEVHIIFRRRTGDGEPIALEHSFYPAARFPDLLQHDLTASLSRLLARVYGVRPARTFQRLEPTVLGVTSAAALSANLDIPVLVVAGTAWDEAGNAVQYGRDVYRGDRISFVAETGDAAEAGAPAMGHLVMGGGRED